MKNTAHVASTVAPSGTNMRWSSACSQFVRAPSRFALVMFTMAWPQSKAKYTPKEISVPKIAPNTPRSRTWNQFAFTLMIETAP